MLKNLGHSGVAGATRSVNCVFARAAGTIIAKIFSCDIGLLDMNRMVSYVLYVLYVKCFKVIL